MGVVEWLKEGRTSSEQQDDGCCWVTSNITESEWGVTFHIQNKASDVPTGSIAAEQLPCGTF